MKRRGFLKRLLAVVAGPVVAQSVVRTGLPNFGQQRLNVGLKPSASVVYHRIGMPAVKWRPLNHMVLPVWGENNTYALVPKP